MIGYSFVMMNGGSGVMKLASSARTRAYSGVPADTCIAWVSSNYVMATPSKPGARQASYAARRVWLCT